MKKKPASYVQQVYIPDRKSWRDWLSENHDKEKSIWLVYDKARGGTRNLNYDDIVEEALCFGWIDSTTRALDEKRSMLYLSVRKPKSVWARSNKERVGRLIKSGQMQPSGLASIEIAKENGSWNSLDDVEALVIPIELEKAFGGNKIAAENFEKFSPSVRKQILYYIYSAKQAETREKRVGKLLISLVANKNPFV